MASKQRYRPSRKFSAIGEDGRQKAAEQALLKTDSETAVKIMAQADLLANLPGVGEKAAKEIMLMLSVWMTGIYGDPVETETLRLAGEMEKPV